MRSSYFKACLALLVASLAASTARAQVPWPFGADSDIGTTPTAGSIVASTDADGVKEYTQVGGGADIWGTSDSFNFAYKKFTGDFDVSLKVRDLQGPAGDGGWSKVELMAREGADSGGAALSHVGGDRFIALMTTGAAGDNEIGMQYRQTTAGDAGEPSGRYGAPTYPNTWLRLQRQGNVFILYTSTDDVTWTERGRQDTAAWAGGALANILSVGLAVTAHNAADITGAIATYSDLKGLVDPNSPLGIVLQPVSQTVVAGTNVAFSVTATGAEPIFYQWFFNGTNLAGASSMNLTFNNVQPASAGNYTVLVTNSSGSVTSSVAVLDVQFILVSINGQPAMDSGTAVASGQVNIAGGYAGGFLFYTLDGSTPTTESTRYTGPFTLTNSAVVTVLGMSADFSQNTLAPPVTVQIIPAYPLVISASGSGAVGLNPASGPYASNSVVVLTATAATNWVFSQWTGDVTSSNNPYSLTINGPLNAQAVFTPTACPLTANTAGGGSVTVNGQVIAPGTYYPTNSVVSITATASNGWSFLNWQGDASGTNNPLDVTMNQTNNIRAIFGTVVGTNAIGGGSIVLNLTNPVAYGTLLTASAVPDAGKYLVAWSSAASGTNSPTTIQIINATPTAGAVFATLPGGEYSLAVVVIGRGSVVISNQQSYYNPGSIVRLTASTTNAGTGFDGWSGDASGTSQTIVLTVNSNMVVQANFGKPLAVITLGKLSQTFDGTAKSVSVTTVPTNLTVNLTYDGSANTPTNAASYTVVVTITDTNYIGGATNTLVINPATPAITMAPTASAITYGQTLADSALSGGTASTEGSFAFTTPGIAPNAGTTNVSVTFTPTDTNDYTTVTATVLVVVNQAPATVTLTNLTQTYNGTAKPVIVATSPIGLNVSLTYNGLSAAPTNVGSYIVIATVNEQNYFGAATNTLVISQAQAIVTISNLTQNYDGTAKPVTTGTIPPNLTVNITYNGSNGIPSAIGSYTVVAAVNDANYYGSATNTLTIIPVPPFVTKQPTNLALVVGGAATFNVSASGTAPLSYQWQKNNVPLADNGFISGSTTSNLTLNAVSTNDAGSYSVVITNMAGSVTSSNANLVVNAEVYVAGTNVLSGSTVSVPIKLKALGQEISLKFSLSFNPNILTYQGVDNLSVIVTTNSPLPGQIGFTFQNFAGYSPGDQALVNVVFAAQPVTSNTVSPINFADVPVGRQVIDGSFNVLSNVTYTGGSVTVLPAEYAADVYPRLTGDSTVDLRDWAEMGRFVTALDVVSNADEMLRADCAPRGNPDGVLTVADWVQAGRYAAKLDPLTVVSSGGTTPQVKPLAGIHPLASSLSLVQLVGSTATNGQTVAVPVNLVASGSENALGFNVAFDPTQLTLQGIAKGSAAGSTVMNVNTNQATTGRLGVTLALNSGNVFASGTNQIAKLSFKVLNQVSGNLGVAFAAINPVVEQVCDINARVLNASYTSAIISVQSGSKPTLQIQLTNGMVHLSWPQASSNYMLQSIGTLGANMWNTNLGSPAVVGANLMITQPATNRVQFYRLSQ